MQFGPSLNEPSLPSWKFSFKQFYWLKTKHRHMLLIVSMEVWSVMRCADLHVHPNDDSEKATEFWHIYYTPIGNCMTRFITPPGK